MGSSYYGYIYVICCCNTKPPIYWLSKTVFLLNRGLVALTLSLLFSFNLQAEFLYKDDVIHNEDFEKEIDIIGQELREKTGVSLYVVALRDVENNTTVESTQDALLQELPDNSILISFVEMSKSVDVVCKPASLYKDFNKAQVLSPFPTFMAALYMASLYGTWEEKKIIMSNYGGSIIPILAQKTKNGDTVKKYSVALFNGYADISEQVAASRGVTLEHAVGNSNIITRDVLRLIFYGVIFIALGYYVYARYFRRRKTDESGE